MSSLLVIIFAVEVAAELINTLGAATINTLLWNVFSALPTKFSAEIAEQRKVQREYLKVRTELNATSSQDEFAKWAKLRRQHDKLMEQLEKKKSTLDSTKASFDKYVSALRWVGTTGLKFFLPFWYAKVPMFWLPHGWFPYYAEWLLAFPRAPMGSVSIASWQLACAGFMLLLRDALAAAVAFAASTKEAEKKPVKVAAGGNTTGRGEKKDL